MSDVGPPAEILIVDDERLSRTLLADALGRAGLSCRQVVDGERALAAVRERVPALVLLDYSMPGGLNGAEVCARLRADPDPDVAQLPVIMLTGLGGEEQEVFCLEAGASDFVTKPVNAAALQARIQTQLRLRALRSQLERQNQELAAWRVELERDLEAARLTQETIIPQHLPTLPGWDLAAHFQPVIQVGGDIYDWLRLPDGRWFFWIADATGHGASAALLTVLAKLLFRHAVADSSSPAEILRTVNADFRQTFKGHSMLTAMGLALDPRTGRASMAGAGHPPLLVARAGGELEAWRSQCPPLGMEGDLTAAEDGFELGPGDGLLLFTDGFYDAIDPAGGRLQFDAFTQMVGRCPTLQAGAGRSAGAASAWMRELLESLREFAGGAAFADDLAALALVRVKEG